MPIVNFTIPDSSPWISYGPLGAWGDSDSATQFYTNGTFHFTQRPGASASFQFNGSAVYLYGALRQNHDQYTVTLDGKNTTANGHTDNPTGVFNVSLFGSGPLESGAHTVTLTNTPTAPSGKYVDLDWAVITVGDGNAKTASQDFWLDDSVASNWTWGEGWGSSRNQLSSQYLNSTFHITNADNAAATLTFYGNAVALYGATSGNHGGYSVSLDGASAQTYNGSQPAFRPQNLLYYASSLPSGRHTLKVTNVGTLFTDIDYAIVSRWDGSVAANTSSSSSSSSSSSAAVTSPTFSLPAPFSSTPPSSSVTPSTPASSAAPSQSSSAARGTFSGSGKGTLLAVASTLAIGIISSLSVL